MAIVYLPSLLRRHTQTNIAFSAPDILACMMMLCEQYPVLRQYIFTQENHFQPFINIYVNGKDIRTLDKEKTALHKNDEIELLLSMAGG